MQMIPLPYVRLTNSPMCLYEKRVSSTSWQEGMRVCVANIRNLISLGCLFHQNDIQRVHFDGFRKIIKQIKSYYIML